MGLLNWKFAIGRIIVAVASGILTGYVTERIFKNKIPAPKQINIDTEPEGTSQEKLGMSKRLVNMLLYSWEFVKMVLPLILLNVEEKQNEHYFSEASSLWRLKARQG